MLTAVAYTRWDTDVAPFAPNLAFARTIVDPEFPLGGRGGSSSTSPSVLQASIRISEQVEYWPQSREVASDIYSEMHKLARRAAGRPDATSRGC